jgi:hypothetical protein
MQRWIAPGGKMTAIRLQIMELLSMRQFGAKAVSRSLRITEKGGLRAPFPH